MLTSRLLSCCARRRLPRRRRTPEKRDEFVPRHLWRGLNTEQFSRLQVDRESNLLDCMTGRSAGFSPLRMRAAQMPIWRIAPQAIGP
jgi:hypothetical protein